MTQFRARMTKTYLRAGLVALLAASAFALRAEPVQASVVQALSLSELVAQSAHIVVATPGERQSRSTGRLIVTDVSLNVVETLKGDSKPGETLVATLLGGAVDGVGLQVPGEASLPQGRKLLVFLQPSKKSGDLRVVGMEQGALPIDVRDGTEVVKPSAGHAALLQRGKDGLVKGDPAVVSEIALADLLTRVRALIR